jgi:hypothetical protein
MKIAVFGLFIAMALFVSNPTFAGSKSGNHDCCGGQASHSEMDCVDYASLNLNPDQKTQIQAWQAECAKAGCTKDSRKTFLKQAKGILSPEQFAKLKAQCKIPKSAKA